jgi:hypothetical protein
MKRQLYSIGGGAIKGTDAGNGREGFFRPVPGSPTADLLNTLQPGDPRHYGMGIFGEGFGGGFGPRQLQLPMGVSPQGGEQAIYPRLGSLTSGVSAAEQELQQINQSIDQVQSDLGAPTGGGIGGGEMNSFNSTPFPIRSGGRPGGQGATLSSVLGFGTVGDPRLGAPIIPGNQLQMMMRGARADGGIMSIQPRQQYGLGSFVKSAVKGVTGAVKGVAKGVKDVVKSDVGKAALLAGGAYFAPTLFGQSAGFGNFGNLIKGGVGSLFSKIPGASTISGFLGGERTLGKTLGVFAGGSLLGGLLAGMPAAEQEEFLQGGRTPEQVEALRIKLTDAYRSQRTFAGRPDENAAIAAQVERDLAEYAQASNRAVAAYGGRIGYAYGDRAEDNAMQASNAMGLPLNQNPAGVTELDLRETGGFIPPVGVKEKADDIPAMLSNNEFVFTADAVRGMGGGDVNKGAQRMYDMMKKLEKGGRV